jgi:peptidoglycan-N-acetylglucosamine deacetylase
MFSEIEIGTLVSVIIGISSLNVLLTCLLFLAKKLGRRRFRIRREISGKVISMVLRRDQDSGGLRSIRRRRKHIFAVLKELSETMEFPESVRDNMAALLRNFGYEQVFIRDLSSFSIFKRMRASLWLPIFKSREAVEALKEHLSGEPKFFIRLAMIGSLIDLKAHDAFDMIFDGMKDGPSWYRKKVVFLSMNFGYPLALYLKDKVQNGMTAGIEDLLVTAAERFPCGEFEAFLLSTLEDPDKNSFRERVLSVLVKTYPRRLAHDTFLRHEVPEIKKAALRALPPALGREGLPLLLEALSDEPYIDTAVAVLRGMMYRDPRLLPELADQLHRESHLGKRNALAEILSDRIEYFIINLNDKTRDLYTGLIRQICRMGKTSALIGFLNRNRSREIEDRLVTILKELLEEDQAGTLYRDLANYLNPGIAERLGINEKPPTENRRRINLLRKDWGLLVLLAVAATALFPLVYFFTAGQDPEIEGFIPHLGNFIIRYNSYFIFYSLAINSSYLILLIFSAFNLLRQLQFRHIRSSRFLFRESVLPSISILAPAYNEGKNIAQSINALLNLKYPDYEVIVINDGSRDDTLDTLISHFELLRTDKERYGSISTAPVRGIFRNPSIPGLTVIDKENGGKADSLNAGINIAGRDYICTIDADSLLEPEALLNMMYQTVLTDTEPVALAGNILPVNGCDVQKGEIRSVKLSRNPLVRFQTIEYLRAFLAGRLGWAWLNCLTIISGAFGVFKRDRVLALGGYLTGRGRYRQDTVGEDMELVIRLHRNLRERKKRYRIAYAFNANCWTEVPEKMKVLRSQRDRWHRGLIEILTFHKQIFFRPRYGRIGLAAFPYFLVFEILGPFFEFFGYTALFLSAVLGLLNAQVVLLLFIAVILYGILISVGSILIAEHEVLYFSTKETLIIFLYAFLENFGFRQFMGMLRFFAYLSFLFKNKEWGEMVRKGFQGGPGPETP